MRLHNHYSDFSFSVNNEFSFSHSNWEILYVTHVTDLTDNLFNNRWRIRYNSAESVLYGPYYILVREKYKS